jgi:hypothetical protein
MKRQKLSNKDRFVEESHLEIAETFQDSGTRTIEKLIILNRG